MGFSLYSILLAAAFWSVSAQAGNLEQPIRIAESPVRLSGSREEQVAQLLTAIAAVSVSPDWVAAQAAFPGARWEERASDTAPTRVEDGITYPSQLESLGYTDILDGSIALNGDRFRITIIGTPDRVTGVRLDAPEGVIVSRSTLRRAFAARGVGWRMLRCDPLGDTTAQVVVELTVGGRSAIFEDSFSGQASAYNFFFDRFLYDPADPPGDCVDTEVRDLR